MPWVAKDQDLIFERHKVRAALENYDFLTSTGSSHEKALERLGYTDVQWRALLVNNEKYLDKKEKSNA